jgi:alkylmercury lyase-like protein
MVPEPDAALIRTVRMALYAAIEATGTAPSTAALANAHGLETAAVESAYRALADGRVIVLEPGTLTVRWAPPFSLVATSFRVRRSRSSWFAPCAWDAFGIPAALDGDARIEATCSWSGDAIACGVEHDRAYGNGVIHLLVPAARFWDDIFFT